MVNSKQLIVLLAFVLGAIAGWLVKARPGMPWAGVIIFAIAAVAGYGVLSGQIRYRRWNEISDGERRNAWYALAAFFTAFLLAVLVALLR